MERRPPSSVLVSAAGCCRVSSSIFEIGLPRDMGLARKDFIQFLAGCPPAVFTNLKRFGVLNFGAAVAARQSHTRAFTEWTAPGFRQPLQPVIGRDFASINPREPFVKLRSVRIQRAYFPLPYVIDGHRDIGDEWSRQLKPILQI